MQLEVNDIEWCVDERRIINCVSLMVGEGQFAGLIGPNGSGKSSLLRTIYRTYKPDAGLITLNKQDVWQMSVREAALQTAVVTQEAESSFEFSVYEMVMMGRTPHKKLFDSDTLEDRQIAMDSLQRVGMQDFASRSYATLSGGEKQRVLVARALTQQSRFLVLDEPTNHLDIRYQFEVLNLVKSLKMTTLAVLHDLNLAAAFCDVLYVLHDGKIAASGKPEVVLTSTLLEEVFGVTAEIMRHPQTQRPHIIYFSQKGAKTNGYI